MSAKTLNSRQISQISILLVLKRNSYIDIVYVKMSKLLFALFALIACAFIGTVSGHGMLWEPVSRSTRWRFNSSAPPNWSDNELYCGGFSVRVMSFR